MKLRYKNFVRFEFLYKKKIDKKYLKSLIKKINELLARAYNIQGYLHATQLRGKLFILNLLLVHANNIYI